MNPRDRKVKQKLLEWRETVRKICDINTEEVK